MSPDVWMMTSDPDTRGLPALKSLIKENDPLKVFAPVDRTDTCIIIYTSGTTEFPKGLMHSHCNLITVGEANVSRLHLQPEDRGRIILPFIHVNAMFYSLGGTLASGAFMILVPKYRNLPFGASPPTRARRL